MSRYLDSYEERVLRAIDSALRVPQTAGEDDPLDWNPSRIVEVPAYGLILEDPETGLLYTVEVQLV